MSESIKVAGIVVIVLGVLMFLHGMIPQVENIMQQIYCAIYIVGGVIVSSLGLLIGKKS